MEKTITITLTLSAEPIKTGDAFYFEQSTGKPTIRIAQEHEDWNGLSGIKNSATGENPYKRIEKVNGCLFSPKITK